MKRSILFFIGICSLLFTASFTGTAKANYSDLGFQSYDDCMVVYYDDSMCGPNDPPPASSDPPPCTDPAAIGTDALGNCVYASVTTPPPIQRAAPPDCSFGGGSIGWDPTVLPFGSITLIGSTMTCNSPVPLQTIAARWCITRDGSDRVCQNIVQGPGVNEIDLGALEWICGYTTFKYEWSAYAVGYATDDFGQTGYSSPTNWPTFTVDNAPNGWSCF